MKVSNAIEAWELADRLFPTGYEKDEERSDKAGYPIYHSTVEGMNAWISDLGNRLKLNYPDRPSENIWIEQEQDVDDSSKLSYKIFITDSSEAASLIAHGMSDSPAQNIIQVSHGNATDSCFKDIIPDIYRKHGKFYATLIYKLENGKSEYELAIC